MTSSQSSSGGPFDRKALRQLMVVLFLVVGSSSSCAQRPTRLHSVPLPILRDGAAITTLQAEVAVSDEDRARGLMFRTSLADGQGMAFVFDADRKLTFWMKDTKIPLSIAFVAHDGRITQIEDMTPLSLSVTESERSVRYAIEVPQGWFTRLGVMPGDVFDLSALLEYLRSSGEEPPPLLN